MLRVEELSIKLGDFDLRNASFEVKEGEYYMILGESGAGKSVLLECLAGLEEINSGKILFQDREIQNEKIQNRSFGLLFQDYAVFPHLTVFENVAYPIKHMGKNDLKERVHKLAEEINITHLLDRYPGKLSGGEQQRVALARTLARDPEILLLDEPLSSLDVHLRADLRKLLRKLNKKGQTIIHVTHDYEEALSLADKLLIVSKGEIVQEGSVEEVIHAPKSRFVASFFGMKNYFPVKSLNGHSDSLSEMETNSGQRFQLINKGLVETGTIMFRNEDVFISKNKMESSAQNQFEGRVLEVLPTPNGIELRVDCGMDIYANISKQALYDLEIEEGSMIWLSIKASAIKFIAG